MTPASTIVVRLTQTTIFDHVSGGGICFLSGIDDPQEIRFDNTPAQGAIAIGSGAPAFNTNAIAMCTNATASGQKSIGYVNTISDNRSGAFGSDNTLSATGAFVIGNSSSVTQAGAEYISRTTPSEIIETSNSDNAFAIGHGEKSFSITR